MLQKITFFQVKDNLVNINTRMFVRGLMMPHYLMYRDLRVNFKKNPTVIMVLCYGTTYLSI